MNSYCPIIAFIMAIALTFSACEKDPSTECVQTIIDEVDYFSVDRTLSNTCKKQQGIDYTLTGNKIYYIKANVMIEAGTIIELEDSASLVISSTGSLQAIGTAKEPIIIRAHYKSTGHWRGIFVRSNSYSNKLEHTHIIRAGGASISGETARGAVVLLDQGRMAINYTKIRESASFGVHLASEKAQLSQFSNNVITNNKKALCLYATQATNLSSTSNFRDNTQNYVQVNVSSPITQAYHWPTINIPYRVTPVNNSNGAIQSIVGSGSLTIGAGNVIEMENGTGIEVRDMGHLSAVGTNSQLILFTGVLKNYGTWKGLAFRYTQADNRFEHVRIEHAGGSQQGVIYMWGNPKVTFLNSEVTYSPACAFYDAPKTANQPINSNLTLLNVLYSYMSSQYCKGH